MSKKEVEQNKRQTFSNCVWLISHVEAIRKRTTNSRREDLAKAFVGLTLLFVEATSNRGSLSDVSKDKPKRC